MELSKNYGVSNVGPQSAVYWVLVLLSLVPVAIVLPLAPTKVGVVIIAGWIALIWVAISFVRGQFHYAVLLWVAAYPYCYYLLSYPADRPIFTLDRVFIPLLGVEMLIASRHTFAGVPLTRDVRISAYFWGLYLLLCFLSLAGHTPSEVLSSYRFLIDGMVLPALFGLYAIRCFPALKDLQKLHLCTCILVLGLFVSGLIELTTDIDLFPLAGSIPMFTDTHLRRPDGPFEQPGVLSIVAILAFFFIIYLRRLMPQRISSRRAWLHRTGCVTSFGAALLPLNRGLVLVLLPIAVIDSCSRHRLISRRKWAAFVGMVVLAAVAAKLSDPRLYDDRVSGMANFYQRLAQHEETLRVVREYPLFGVGLNLYHKVAAENPRYMATWQGIESMTFPHNVLMTVLSEEGIFGLLLYVLAQVFFIRGMWRIRKAYPPGWLAFLYCVLVYLLIGLDYGTVYFSDINLFYIFVLGVIYQLQTKISREQGFGVLASPDRNASRQVVEV